MSSVAPKGALGDPPRFDLRVEHGRAIYVIEWERDWLRPYGIDGEEPARVASRKVYLSRRGAYEALARKMIFAKRDGFETATTECSLCAAEPQYRPDDPRFCRYHDSETFQRLTRRLARWLMWRDRRRADGR